MSVYWFEEFINDWLEQRIMIKALNLDIARRKAEKLSRRINYSDPRLIKSELRILKDGILVARKTSSAWEVFCNE